MSRRLREFIKTEDENLYKQNGGGIVIIDINVSNYYKVTLDQNLTVTFVPGTPNQINDYVIELVNAGSYAITWDTPTQIKWVQVDGTMQNAPNTSFNSDGTSDFVLLFESDGNLYGKVLR